MTIVTAFVAGLLFDAGPIVSGMANPAKVLGFFDPFDQRGSSLTFMMVGAVAVGVIAFFVACRRGRSWLDTSIQLPSATGMTARLVLGSAVLSIGWGLAGFCPGPALVALGVGVSRAVGFVAVVLAGMTVSNWLQRKCQAGSNVANRPITHLQKTI